MRPVVIGGIVAAIVIAAFAIGMRYQDESETPAEEISDAIEGALDGN